MEDQPAANSNAEMNKKSYALIYIIVAVFYCAMIICYGFVIHNATEDGAICEYTVPPNCDDSSNSSSALNRMTSLIKAVQSSMASVISQQQ